MGAAAGLSMEGKDERSPPRFHPAAMVLTPYVTLDLISSKHWNIRIMECDFDFFDRHICPARE